MIFKILIVRSKEDFLQAIFLRRKVLVDEFGYSTNKEEPDKVDQKAIIYVVKNKGIVVGTLRVIKKGQIYRIQRFAIKKSYRNKGVGSLFLKRVFKDFEKIYLMAPKETIPFYQKNGFKLTNIKEKGEKRFYFRMQNY